MNTIKINQPVIKILFCLLLSILFCAGLPPINPTRAADEEIVFTKKGTIDRIDEHSIVINDCSYTFSSTSHFIRENGEPTSISAFKDKDFISYQATTSGKIISISSTSSRDEQRANIRGHKAVTPHAPPSADQPPGTNQKPAEIIFENGKWHN
jgi:hypothetical protein